MLLNISVKEVQGNQLWWLCSAVTPGYKRCSHCTLQPTYLYRLYSVYLGLPTSTSQSALQHNSQMVMESKFSSHVLGRFDESYFIYWQIFWQIWRQHFQAEFYCRRARELSWIVSSVREKAWLDYNVFLILRMRTVKSVSLSSVNVCQRRKPVLHWWGEGVREWGRQNT